jgi:N-acetylmuramoyl-L-alanine amidase CwlA
MVALNYEIIHIKKHPTTRPGLKLLRLQAGILHWTANPGANADDHHKYFNETLPNQNDQAKREGRLDDIRYASANIFVDRHKALELVPVGEVCFQGNDGGTKALKLPALKATAPYYKYGNANLLCASIEMCVERDGSIHPDTIARTALVIKKLQKDHPQLRDTQNRWVRHFDVTGKNCPAPMVSNPRKWNELLDLVDAKTVSTPSVAAKIVKSEKDSADGKLERGEAGPNVKLLNNMLHTLEYTRKTDELFDQYTEAALKAFQKDYRLKPDAVYTSEVGRVMIKAIKEKESLKKASDLPKKNPELYRLAKLIDTGNSALIESLLKEGYKILDTPK